MRLMLLGVVLSALFLVACGSRNSGSLSVSASAALASLPATLDGKFAAVGGGMETDGSEFFLGGLTVGGEEVSVKVSKSVVDSAGLSQEDGGLPTSADTVVRATIGSKIDFLGEPLYVVSAMKRL